MHKRVYVVLLEPHTLVTAASPRTKCEGCVYSLAHIVLEVKIICVYMKNYANKQFYLNLQTYQCSFLVRYFNRHQSW